MRKSVDEEDCMVLLLARARKKLRHMNSRTADRELRGRMKG